MGNDKKDLNSVFTEQKESDCELLICDRQGKIIKPSRKFRELTGCSDKDIINLPFTNFIAIDERDKFRKILKDISTIEGNLSITLKIICKDHEYVTSTIRLDLETDAAGEEFISLDIDSDFRQSDKWRINFQALFNQPAIGIIIATPEGVFLDVNACFANMLGYNPYEMTGMNFKEITHTDDLEEDSRLNLEMRSGKRSYFEYEKRYLHKNGQPVWVRIFSNMISDDDGRNLYGIVSVVNIDIQKKIEQQLNIKNEELIEKNEVLKAEYEIIDVVLKRLEDAERLGSFGTFEFDIRKNCGWWSDNQYALHGYEVDEVVPSYKVHLQCVHADDRGKIEENFNSIMQSKNESGSINYRMIDYHGNLKYIHSEYSVVKNENGEPEKIFGIDQDITLNYIYEEKIRDSEEEFRLLTELSPNIIMKHDIEGKITYINERGCSFFGLSKKTMIGSSIDFLLPESRAVQRRKLVHEIIETKNFRLYKSEMKLLNADEKERILKIYAQPIIKNEIFTGMFIVADDITELKEREIELEKHKEHLEELVKKRTERLELQKTDLENLNKLFTGREFRIKELRDEVKKLKQLLKEAGE